ncbi:MAG: response regulator transcription factor [Patescibacteria group bacterium]
MKLLIIEDDKNLADTLATALRGNNYSVDVVNDARIALNLIDFSKYDLLISDYLMPHLNGYELIKEIRKKYLSLPIIMLSAISESSNKTKLLDIGADDYLSKPFSVRELLSRINAVVRRKNNQANLLLTFSNLILDINRGSVIKDGKIIHLTNKEILLLEYLLKNPKIFCSKQDIINTVWGEETHLLSNTLEAHILKLRKKIDSKKSKLLHTKINYGYKIDESP